MSDKEPPADTTSEAWSKFVQACGAMFSNWTCLALAVDNCWGGMNSKKKGEEMLQDCLTMFANGGPRVYGDELSDFFEDRILDNYSTDAEDGSCREVADKIVRQFELCYKKNDYTEADVLISGAGAAAQRALAQCVEAPTTVDNVAPALSGGCPSDPGLGGGAGALERPTLGPAAHETKSAIKNSFAHNNFWSAPMMTTDDDPVLAALSSPKQAPSGAAATSGYHSAKGEGTNAYGVVDRSSAPVAMETGVPRGSRGIRGNSPEKPRIDEDGFETVTRKGRRRRGR